MLLNSPFTLKILTVRSHWPISVLSTLSSAVNMLMPLVLVRLLEPDEIGRFKIFFLYLMIFPTFAFMTGVTNGLSYWAGHGDRGRRLIQVSGRVILGVSAVFLVACLGLQNFLEDYLGWGTSQTVLFSFALFGALASTFFEDSSIALGKVWQGALFSSGWELARTLAILLTAVLTRSIVAIFAAHTLVQLAKTALGYGLAEKSLLKGAVAVEAPVQKIMGYAFPVSLAYVFGVFVNYSDQVLVSSFLSPADFAFYAIGCLVVPPLTILEHSVTRVLIPELSAAFKSEQKSKAARLYLKSVEELSFLLIPAVVGMVVFAQPIILLLFTSKFAGAEQYLRVYAVGYLALIIPYDSIPRARGQSRWIFSNFLAFSVLSLGLCYALIRAFGPMGALVGGVAAKLLMRAYAILYIRADSGWAWESFLPVRPAIRSMVVALGLAVLCLIANNFFSSPMAWFFVMGSVFFVLYFVLMSAWGRAAFLSSPQKPGVLMLTQYLGLGGLERMILNLSTSLQAQGQWQPQVFVFEHAQYAEPASHLGAAFEAVGIPVTYFTKSPGFSFKTVVKVTSQEISVIHTHDLGALIYGAFAKVGCMGRVRLVHTQHSFVHLSRNPRYQMYEKFFTRFADQVAVVSPDTQETYRALGISDGVIHFIPNGVRFAEPGSQISKLYVAKAQARDAAIASLPETVSARAILQSQKQAHWILYMARLHGRKGQDQAMKLWSVLNPGVRQKSVLLFVGLETEAGQKQRLTQLMQAAPDPDRVHYLGPSLSPELWLRAADLFLSSSEFEGMPLASIEASGSGLPLILSDIPGHRMLANSSSLYSLESPEQGARSVEQVIAEIEKGPDAFFEAKWRDASVLRDQYSVEGMARAYANLYRFSTGSNHQS